MTRRKPPSTLPEQYWAWLYDQIFDVRDAVGDENWRSFTQLTRTMHNIEFKALVDYDENRIADAVGFRNNYNRLWPSEGLALSDLMEPDATIFEVLFGLAKRADDMIPMTVAAWFRCFIENLGLAHYNDEYCMRRVVAPAVRILNRFNDRTYKKDGRGGIFPLKKLPTGVLDMTDVELWYQMGYWMTEKQLY
jgi:hypothetical protein